MRINVSAWSIRRPVPAIVLFAVLMLLGTLSFKALPVTRFPNIDVPIVSVTVSEASRDVAYVTEHGEIVVHSVAAGAAIARIGGGAS